VDEAILEEEERALLASVLCREPTVLEEAITQGLWNEHCSYKSSKLLIERFHALGTRLGGIDENAGGVRLKDGTVVVFKMESHNHPSFIEPFQGAATGVGGILRDIFAMGARPIALLDALFFGEPGFGRTPYLASRVIDGIAWYGNCVGVPTVGGMFVSDAGYNTNCLVNVMAVGVLEPGQAMLSAKARGVGNLIVYAGQKTGPDGIYGSRMASKSFSVGVEQLRPQVQVGDPFKGKLLIEATLSLARRGLVLSCQDFGASGLVSSVFEMAYKGNIGVRLNLDAIPLRMEGLKPWEILLSESQERMVYVVLPENAEEVLKVLQGYELDAAVIGELVQGEEIEVFYRSESLIRFPHLRVLKAAPRLNRPMAPPLTKQGRATGPVGSFSAERLGAILGRLIGHPSVGSKEDIYRQYDHEVGIRTLVPPSLGPSILRVYPTTKDTAIAVVTGSRPFLAVSDPRGAAHQLIAWLSLALASSGATAVGMTNCLNFGTPEDPKIMHALKETIEGLAEACEALGIAVVSGNVSLYNTTEDTSILPTAVVGMVGEVQIPLEEVDQEPILPDDKLWVVEYDKPSLKGSQLSRLMPTEWADEGLISADFERHRGLLALATALRADSVRLITPGGGGTLPSIVKRLLEQAKRPDRPVAPLDTYGIQLDPEFCSDPVSCFGEGCARFVAVVRPSEEPILLKQASLFGLKPSYLGKVVREPEVWLGQNTAASMEDLFLKYTSSLRAFLE
jgi:phosphoribosylformylglycinamidine synthase